MKELDNVNIKAIIRKCFHLEHFSLFYYYYCILDLWMTRYRASGRIIFLRRMWSFVVAGS